MGERTLRLSIEGPLDGMDPRALSNALDAVATLLAQISDGHQAWSLAGLQVGSAHVMLRGPAEDVAIIQDGLATLADRPVVPARWPIDAVRALTRLDGPRRLRGVTGIVLEIDHQISRIDDILLGNAHESIQPGAPSLGAVTGQLFRYNHLDLTAGIRDEFRGEQITVRFPPAMAEQIRDYLTLTVRVSGEVQRDARGRRTQITAERIELAETVPAPRPASEIAGLFTPDARPGVDAVAWQRTQRHG